MAEVVLENISKSFGDIKAVDDISMTIPNGAFVVLLGPTGAGKTTTLRALAGILPPSAGQIAVCGFDMVRQPIDAKRCLAFIPDDPRLFE